MPENLDFIRQGNYLNDSSRRAVWSIWVLGRLFHVYCETWIAGHITEHGQTVSKLSQQLPSLVVQTVMRLSTMRETQVQSLGWEDPLEKEMAIHSRTIAWKIPWTEESGRLQSMRSQRVRHEWTTSLCLCPIVCSCLLCQKQATHRCMDLCLGFLSCSIVLYFCFYASTILSWWL